MAMPGKKQKKYHGVYSREGKKGTTYLIDYVDPQTSCRVRKTLKGCRSMAEAARIRAIKISKSARDKLKADFGIKDNMPILFEDALDWYFENWSKIHKQHRTDRQRASILRREFGGRLLSDITPSMVQEFKARTSISRTKNTVNKYLSLGSQIYKKSIELRGYQGENPFLLAGRFKIPKGKKPGALSVQEVAAIVNEIKHPVKKDMVLFAFNTGWRISEITGLKWKDVDLKKGAAWLSDTKNKSPAEIALNDAALDIIRRQGKKGDYVFCFKNGKQFKTGLAGGFKNAAARAGIKLPPRKAWHILRRTWATMFLQAGGDIETLRVLGNWKDFMMPMWYAEDAQIDHKKRILNRLPKINVKKMSKK